MVDSGKCYSENQTRLMGLRESGWLVFAGRPEKAAFPRGSLLSQELNHEKVPAMERYGEEHPTQREQRKRRP